MANLLPLEKIENKILLIRGEKVMLDRDLAELYGVSTGSLNQAVKRNKERFPADFIFQLTKMEAEYLAAEGYLGESLRSQFVTLNNSEFKRKNNDSKNLISQNVISSWGGTRKLPYVFTEQGVAMLSSVLRSKRAVEVNITIMRAFVKIRKLIYSYKDLADKIAAMEKKYDKHIGEIFRVLDFLTEDKKNNKKEIGFKCK